MSVVVRWLMLAVLLFGGTGARCGDRDGVKAGAELGAVLDGLFRSASPEQHRQIVDAIAASPTLTREFDGLAARSVLTGIDVLPVAGPRQGIKGPFDAAIVSSHIVLSDALVTALARNRLVDVVQPDEVLPNNTVFVLAHLAYHLGHPLERRPGPDDTRESWVAKRLANEAMAFIDGWNAMVEEATMRHGGPLTVAQAGSMLSNCRYRFAFIGMRDQQIAAPSFAPAGTIEPTGTNVAAVVRILEHARLSDLE